MQGDYVKDNTYLLYYKVIKPYNKIICNMLSILEVVGFDRIKQRKIRISQVRARVISLIALMSVVIGCLNLFVSWLGSLVARPVHSSRGCCSL
jgi:hypothetical protein